MSRTGRHCLGGRQRVRGIDVAHMKASELPRRHQETLVRKAMQRAELIRYWWEYRGRLRELLRVVDPGRAVRLNATAQQIRDHWTGYGVEYVNLDWYRLFKALTGRQPAINPEGNVPHPIEPFLYRRDMSAAFHDKIQLDDASQSAATAHHPAEHLRCLLRRELSADCPRRGGRASRDAHQVPLPPAIAGSRKGSGTTWRE